MDSINRNQPEHNHQSLAGREAIDKIKALVNKAQTCFFCTSIAIGNSRGTRPMSVRRIDDDANLWFLSANDSFKNREIELDPAVRLFFQGSAHSDFLTLHGLASVSTDQARIHEFWSPVIRTWFTEGETDPRITVIKVTPTDGYYWDTKHGSAIAGIKMLIGAAIGQTLDDSIEGNVTVAPRSPAPAGPGTGAP